MSNRNAGNKPGHLKNCHWIRKAHAAKEQVQFQVVPTWIRNAPGIPKMKKAPVLPPMSLNTWPRSDTSCGQGRAGRVNRADQPNCV